MAERALLTSWKEIAAYLGVSVRTAQRWEQELGLPVHRPDVGKHSPIFARYREVDGWLTRNSKNIHPGAPPRQNSDLRMTTAARLQTLTRSVLKIEDQMAKQRSLRDKLHQIRTTGALTKILRGAIRGSEK